MFGLEVEIAILSREARKGSSWLGSSSGDPVSRGSEMRNSTGSIDGSDDTCRLLEATLPTVDVRSYKQSRPFAAHREQQDWKLHLTLAALQARHDLRLTLGRSCARRQYDT